MSREQCRRRKLPSDSPYVGNFHRGFSVTTAKGIQPWPQDKWHGGSTFGRSASEVFASRDAVHDQPLARLASQPSLPSVPQTGGQVKKKTIRRSATEPESLMTAEAEKSLDVVVEGEKSPSSSSRNASVVVEKVATTLPSTPGSQSVEKKKSSFKMTRPLSSTDLSTEMSRNDDEVEAPVSQPRLPAVDVKAHFRVENMPESPELCGLQASLPRQSGVQIVEKLGEGSFGKVVLAINKRNSFSWNDSLERHTNSRCITKFPNEGEKVVLKCVKKSHAGFEGVCVACMQREVKIHAMMDHNNIAKFYGHYDNGEYVTLILGFIEGKELGSILFELRRFPEEKTRTIGLQILRALDYMHRLGVVHRDVNTRNVLVTEKGRVFMIDLGLALDTNDSANDCECCNPAKGPAGTIGYIAPECILGEQATEKADMFPYGCLLYEMMFGFKPFQGHEVLTMQVEFPDDSWGMPASEECRDLITKSLEKTDSARVSSAEALLHPWFTLESFSEVDALLSEHERERGVLCRRSSLMCDETPPTWDGEEISTTVPSSPQLPGPNSAATLALTIAGLHDLSSFPPLDFGFSIAELPDMDIGSPMLTSREVTPMRLSSSREETPLRLEAPVRLSSPLIRPLEDSPLRSRLRKSPVRRFSRESSPHLCPVGRMSPARCFMPRSSEDNLLKLATTHHEFETYREQVESDDFGSGGGGHHHHYEYYVATVAQTTIDSDLTPTPCSD